MNPFTCDDNGAYKGVSVTIRNLAFCLALHLTGVHFRGEFQHVGDVSKQKFKCRQIRTREIGGVRLPEALYVILKDGPQKQTIS